MDASPSLPVVDVLALATITDKVLLIVEWGHKPHVSTSEAFKILRPEVHRVAGVVPNKVDLKPQRESGYRGYHYRAATHENPPYWTGVSRYSRRPLHATTIL
jgi:Mrp family chromosome partitioning ATPase